MAAKHPIVILLLAYLVFFGIALRFFLAGHHILALVTVFTTWAVLSAWLYFGGAK